MGWYLFRTGVIIDQSASGEFRGAKVVLTKVGPGIFFALFGTIVLAVGLISPVRLGRDVSEFIPTRSDQKPTPNPSIVWAGTETTINIQENVPKILNAFEPLIRHQDFHFPKLYPENKVNQAIDTLKNLRDRLLIDKFGQNDFNRFVENRDRYLKNPQNYSQKDRDIFSQMEKIYAAEFEQ
jgi:hypothetical protein